LFGSRARGDYSEDSDWDILIVTKKKLDSRIRERFLLGIMRRWTKYRLSNSKYDQDLHIIIVSKESFEKYKDILGDIIGFAVLEGIVI